MEVSTDCTWTQPLVVSQETAGFSMSELTLAGDRSQVYLNQSANSASRQIPTQGLGSAVAALWWSSFWQIIELRSNESASCARPDSGIWGAIIIWQIKELLYLLWCFRHESSLKSLCVLPQKDLCTNFLHVCVCLWCVCPNLKTAKLWNDDATSAICFSGWIRLLELSLCVSSFHSPLSSSFKQIWHFSLSQYITMCTCVCTDTSCEHVCLSTDTERSQDNRGEQINCDVTKGLWREL